MYLGRIVELAPATALYRDPKHPYTQALLSAVPSLEPGKRRQRILLPGDVPSPANAPRGCAFHTRCPHAMAICREQAPALKAVDTDHRTACWLYEK
jgi:oligopeptide transport system ATP-binding protein